MSDIDPDHGDPDQPGEDLTDPAAEYVLGLQTPEDRSRFARRLRTDVALQAEVAAWEARLTPLLDEVEAVRPPNRVWAQIARAIEPGANVEPFSRPTRLWDQVGVWRGATAALLAVAACLILVAVLPARRPPPTTPSQDGATLAAATLTSPSGKVLYVATLDRAGQRLTIVPVQATAPDSRTPELWIIPAVGAPRPVGLLRTHRPVQLFMATGWFTNAAPPTLAVSLEPLGGSTTGKPTGPIIATGPVKAA